MKKLSVLIAMILCVTIGGVYAAWTYTNPDADITDERFEQLITISTAKEEGAAGVYNIETNITGMSIEQLGTNAEGKDFHTAVLQYATSDSATPYVRFTLKLQENTGDDIFTTLTSTYSIDIVDLVNPLFDNDGDSNTADENIFIDHKSGTTEIAWQYDSANDIYYFEIDNINSEITLNDIVLASKARHTAFSNALGRAVLEIKISDGIVPQA